MDPIRVTVIKGDGIGPEVVGAALRVLEATGIPFVWDFEEMGMGAQEKLGEGLPDATLDSIRRNRVALKGPCGTPDGTATERFRSVNVALRTKLDLYACVRPVHYYEGAPSPLKDPRGIHLVVVRENIEDLYAGIEFPVNKDETKRLLDFVEIERGIRLPRSTAIGLKPISLWESLRIAKYAFHMAQSNKAFRCVTVVHKANIQQDTDGLFLHAAREVAKEYPDVEFQDRHTDAMLGELVAHPQLFGVILTPNVVGDEISSLAARLVGGEGMAPGANFGNEYAVFEATHGTAPTIAGKGIANPCSMILSAAMMVRHLAPRGTNQPEKNGFTVCAHLIEEAVAAVVREGTCVTGDLNPLVHASTTAMTDAVIAWMRKQTGG